MPSDLLEEDIINQAAFTNENEGSFYLTALPLAALNPNLRIIKVIEFTNRISETHIFEIFEIWIITYFSNVNLKQINFSNLNDSKIWTKFTLKESKLLKWLIYWYV